MTHGAEVRLLGPTYSDQLYSDMNVNIVPTMTS